jgi:DNA excision repair protein ERCC-4
MGALLEVDYRERASALFPLVAACSDFNVRVGRLVAGDYIVGREIVIERKTAADFVASVIDARIFRQAQRLAAAQLRPLLIVEGEPTGLHPHAWIGSILSVAVQWRVPVIRCTNADESLIILRLLAAQTWRASQVDLPRAGYRPRRIENRKLFVLQGLPGVGPALARRLLERFGSIERVMEADEEELCGVSGIGPSKAAAIRAIIQ